MNKDKRNKVLIIEDNETHFEKMKEYLTEIRYSVIPSNQQEIISSLSDSSEESIDDYALRQISEHRNEIALVLCDIELGKDQEGGLAVASRIRQNDEEGLEFLSAMIPIIGITHLSEDQNGMVKAGADVVLKKPDFSKTTRSFSKSMLRTVIDQYVEKFILRMNSRIPYSLRSKVKKFKQRNEGKTTAFIMTSYKERHLLTAGRIKEVLNEYGIKGCMANDVEGGLNTDSLWSNIEVYIHGCDFGIGIYANDNDLKDAEVFDMVTGDPIDKKYLVRINANLSQEVGYMLALQKQVCILKEDGLDKVPSDLAEKIYVQYKESDLEEKLRNWLEGKGYKRIATGGETY